MSSSTDPQRSPGAPVVWLMGKVQSGKSSIVRAITASSDVEIGEGFKPCTRTSRILDFPEGAPVIRFLDTRGLEETGYDPAADLEFAERQSQVVLMTMRALDMRQDRLISAVSEIRRRHPEWPIVVAQTCLHDGYRAGKGHPTPYPFGRQSTGLLDDSVRADLGAADLVPADLMRSLAKQRVLFETLPGSGAIEFVPLDFTRDGDGFEPQLYGYDALIEALVHVAPHAIAAVVAAMPQPERDARARRAQSLVLGHAMAAAGGDLVPIAGAIAVSAIQTRLLQQLGALHAVSWDRKTMTEFAAALGGGVITRTLAGLGLRQLTKLIPVYGQTIGAAGSAAMSFAVTFALGKAATYFLERRRTGALTGAAVAEVYQQALREALRRGPRDWATRGGGGAPTARPTAAS